MKYRMRWPRGFNFAKCVKVGVLTILVAAGYSVSASRGGQSEPKLYVPYQDLAELIEPAHKAVLMDRGQFEQLLAAAEVNARQADSIELGQVKQARYSAEIVGEKLTLTGKLEKNFVVWEDLGVAYDCVDTLHIGTNVRW